MVPGDSGNGKTYLFDFIRKSQSAGKFSNVLCHNIVSDKVAPILQRLQNVNLSNTLIIIDNADLILNDEARSYILRDYERGNIYLIFGRDPRGLDMSIYTIAQFEERDDTIHLNYLA